jgi:hypothetical protein
MIRSAVRCKKTFAPSRVGSSTSGSSESSFRTRELEFLTSCQGAKSDLAWAAFAVPGLRLRQCRDYGVGEFLGAGFSAYVLCYVLAVFVDLDQGLFDPLGRGLFAQVIEHQD